MVDFTNNSYNFTANTAASATVDDNTTDNNDTNNDINTPVVTTADINDKQANDNPETNNIIESTKEDTQHNEPSNESYTNSKPSEIISEPISVEPENFTPSIPIPTSQEILETEESLAVNPDVQTSLNDQTTNIQTVNTVNVVPDTAKTNIETVHFTSSGKVADETELKVPSSKAGLLKLILLLFIPLSLTAGAIVYGINSQKENQYLVEKEVLLVVPMTSVNWQDIGTVFEPLITIPIKTQSGFEKWEFLLDSGAVISSLPREWADKIGLDLAFMKRSTFRGFGGKTSFAYQGDMVVSLGDQEQSLPVVFTESSGTKSLLGRKGFFENYSVYFNHKEKRIEIRK